jgi:hypothetical protein
MLLIREALGQDSHASLEGSLHIDHGRDAPEQALARLPIRVRQDRAAPLLFLFITASSSIKKKAISTEKETNI